MSSEGIGMRIGRAKPWTLPELKHLVELSSQGKSGREMAAIFRRTEDAIYSKLGQIRNGETELDIPEVTAKINRMMKLAARCTYA